jgi:ubiquitin C-terminal hydrolase
MDDNVTINAQDTSTKLIAGAERVDAERVDAERVDGAENTDGEPNPLGQSGIINVGNTCYMNSAIQAISHTSFLRHYLLNEESKIILILLTNAKKIISDINLFCPEECIDNLMKKVKDPSYHPQMLTVDEKLIVLNNTMTYQTIRLVKGLWKANCVVNPCSFRRIFTEVRNKFFYGDDQHDAEEAYSCVIQKMQEELGTKVNVSFKTHNPSLGNLISYHQELNGLLKYREEIQQKINEADTREEKNKYLNLYLEKKRSMPVEGLMIDAFKEMKKYYETGYSRISELFTGFYHSVIECPDSNCKNASHKFNAYYQLQFEMPVSSMIRTAGQRYDITECMGKFCEVEILDSNNLWKCDKCKESVAAHKQLMLWTSPVVLVIHLKRFGSDRIRKDTRKIEYPLINLDISSMISPANKDAKNKCYRYDLFSVINHVGGMQGGHYFSYCLDESSGRWYKYDDRSVGEIGPNQVVTSSAYLLFYLRRDMLKHQHI